MRSPQWSPRWHGPDDRRVLAECFFCDCDEGVLLDHKIPLYATPALTEIRGEPVPMLVCGYCVRKKRHLSDCCGAPTYSTLSGLCRDHETTARLALDKDRALCAVHLYSERAGLDPSLRAQIMISLFVSQPGPWADGQGVRTIRRDPSKYLLPMAERDWLSWRRDAIERGVRVALDGGWVEMVWSDLSRFDSRDLLVLRGDAQRVFAWAEEEGR